MQDLIDLFRQDPGVLALIERWKARIIEMPASRSHHHTETGGWLRHTLDVIRLAEQLYEILPAAARSAVGPVDRIRRLAFLHDLDKLDRYRRVETIGGLPVEQVGPFVLRTVQAVLAHRTVWVLTDRPPVEPTAWIARECGTVGIGLSDADLHVLACVHGGWSGIVRQDDSISISPTEPE